MTSKTGSPDSFHHDPESEAFIAECAEEELLPAEEWCRRLGYIIADPDGWRGRQALPWETPIARNDFVARAGISTCLAWPASLAERKSQRRTQTVHITLTVDLPGDLRAAADGALRREFPRGKWEVTGGD